MEAIKTTLWPIKMFSHAVFQRMLVDMRFQKCTYAWERIISLSEKKEKPMYMGSGQSAGGPGWAVYISILKTLRSLLDAGFPRNPIWERGLEVKNLNCYPGI